MGELVSIMMPVFNGEFSVGFALASVLAQTYHEWECIVVDDGSQDGTAHVLASITDPRVRVITLRVNRGRGAAREVALQHARGEFLAFLDADDWMYPGKLQRQVDVLHRFPDAAAVSGKYAVVDHRVNLVGMHWGLAAPTDQPVVRRFRHVCRPPLNYPMAMLRMDVARPCHFDPARRRVEDMDFLLKALRDKDFVIDPIARFAYSGWRLDRGRSRRTAKAERGIYRLYMHKEPIAATAMWLSSALKSLALSLPSSIASEIRSGRHTVLQPDAGEVRAFREALEAVTASYRENVDIGALLQTDELASVGTSGDGEDSATHPSTVFGVPVLKAVTADLPVSVTSNMSIRGSTRLQVSNGSGCDSDERKFGAGLLRGPKWKASSPS